jgi:hypothetical protein
MVDYNDQLSQRWARREDRGGVRELDVGPLVTTQPACVGRCWFEAEHTRQCANAAQLAGLWLQHGGCAEAG